MPGAMRQRQPWSSATSNGTVRRDDRMLHKRGMGICTLITLHVLHAQILHCLLVVFLCWGEWGDVRAYLHRCPSPIGGVHVPLCERRSTPENQTVATVTASHK